MSNVKCPRCGSDRLVAGKDDFKVGDALLWGYITGSWVVGALAGSPSNKNLKVHCLSCRAKLEPYEVRTQTEISKEPIDPKSIDGLGYSTCQYCNKFMVIDRVCISCGGTQYKFLNKTYSKAEWSKASKTAVIVIAILFFLFFTLLLTASFV